MPTNGKVWADQGHRGFPDVPQVAEPLFEWISKGAPDDLRYKRRCCGADLGEQRSQKQREPPKGLMKLRSLTEHDEVLSASRVRPTWLKAY